VWLAQGYFHIQSQLCCHLGGRRFVATRPLYHNARGRAPRIRAPYNALDAQLSFA
jgi:hypothetical protein